MKSVLIGEVIDFCGQLYVISGFCREDDGVILAFYVKPFIGDPNNRDDINAALGGKSKWTLNATIIS